MGLLLGVCIGCNLRDCEGAMILRWRSIGLWLSLSAFGCLGLLLLGSVFLAIVAVFG
jgi:hypothetical protein